LGAETQPASNRAATGTKKERMKKS